MLKKQTEAKYTTQYLHLKGKALKQRTKQQAVMSYGASINQRALKTLGAPKPTRFSIGCPKLAPWYFVLEAVTP